MATDSRPARPGVGDIADSDDARVKRLFKDEPVKVYDFFADEFFDIQTVVAQVACSAHSAALKGEDIVLSTVPDEAGWRDVKETLLRNIGMGGIPVIRVHDADYGHNRALYLTHAHDGLDLQLEYAEKTLSYIHRLWQRDVALETLVSSRRSLLIYTDRGFSSKTLK